MKFSVLTVILFFSAIAQASAGSSSNTIAVQCTGNLGAAQLNQTFQFGGANLNKQEIAVHENVTYLLQLASFKGFIDILIWQEVRDQKGEVLASSYIRSHGGTELDLVDNVKNVTLVCALGGTPP